MQFRQVFNVGDLVQWVNDWNTDNEIYLYISCDKNHQVLSFKTMIFHYFSSKAYLRKIN